MQINLRFKNQVEKFNLYFEGTIFSATDLFNRIDILEIDSNGVVLLIKVEDAEIAIKPIPVGRYEIGQISINGATVSEIVISTNGFITKSSKSFIRMFNTGDIDKVAMEKSLG
jgi:hypothetical protein